MATSIIKMNELMNRDTTSKHSKVCKCTFCMKVKLKAEELPSHEHAFQSTMVDRRDPINPVKPLMISTEGHAVLQAGGAATF